MAGIIENARKGQRKAMESLYEKNKRKVFEAARMLLMDEKQSADVMCQVFRNIWSDGAMQNLNGEDAFTGLIVSKMAELCKKRQQSSKAFRIPPNKNFQISSLDGTYDEKEKPEEFVLRQLPVLHRFILVLHTVCGFEPDKLAKLLKLDGMAVQAALEAEKGNIERILAMTGNGTLDSYEAFTNVLLQQEESASVPAKADEQVLAAIDAIAKPLEQKQKKKNGLIGFAAAAVCICIIAAAVFASSLRKPAEGGGQTDSLKAASEEAQGYYADIDIEGYGTVTFKLEPEAAPITTDNFIKLANDGFYDGLTFHRIISGFMMQGGDPNGDGTGGSDETIEGEFSENGHDNTLSHTRGAVSMARSNDYNSASSQFFIVHEDSTFLDGEYAVFGYVTEGMDIVDAICEAAEPGDGGMIAPDVQPVITKIEIRTE